LLQVVGATKHGNTKGLFSRLLVGIDNFKYTSLAETAFDRKVNSEHLLWGGVARFMPHLSIASAGRSRSPPR
jgi:hypothetical protein